MMNMLMGTRLASSPVAAQVLPVPIEAPLLEAMGLKSSPPAPVSVPAEPLTVPELIVPAEPVAPPAPLGKPLVDADSELQPANAVAARPPAAISTPRPALRP